MALYPGFFLSKVSQKIAALPAADCNFRRQGQVLALMTVSELELVSELVSESGVGVCVEVGVGVGVGVCDGPAPITPSPFRSCLKPGSSDLSTELEPETTTPPVPLPMTLPLLSVIQTVNWSLAPLGEARLDSRSPFSLPRYSSPDTALP